MPNRAVVTVVLIRLCLKKTIESLIRIFSYISTELVVYVSYGAFPMVPDHFLIVLSANGSGQISSHFFLIFILLCGDCRSAFCFTTSFERPYRHGRAWREDLTRLDYCRHICLAPMSLIGHEQLEGWSGEGNSTQWT